MSCCCASDSVDQASGSSGVGVLPWWIISMYFMVCAPSVGLSPTRRTTDRRIDTSPEKSWDHDRSSARGQNRTMTGSDGARVVTVLPTDALAPPVRAAVIDVCNAANHTDAFHELFDLIPS